MQTIPLNQLVTINPGVLAPAGQNNSLNGLLLSQDAATPLGTPSQWASADDVGNFYGFQSPEYEAALIYFQGPLNKTKTPGLLWIAQYNAAAAPAYLRSAKLGLTLTQLQAIPAGVLTLTVNGVAATSSSINLSGATSFSNAATLIQAGFTSPAFAVTWDAQRQAFLFTTTATGAAATITAASGTLSAPLSLTAATGAITQQGAVAATPGAFMAALIQVTQNWALFTTTWEPVLADKEAFSAWTATTNDVFGYVGFDSSAQAKAQGGAGTWAQAIIASADEGSVPVYGDVTHATFVLSWAASLDLTRTNGRSTLAFRGQSGLIPSVTNGTDATNLIANGYNFYGVYANATQSFNLMYPGSVTGQYKWLDSYIDQIWIRSSLQSSLIQLLINMGSIPYNTPGYQLVESACQDPINAAINFGAIRAGVTLSDEQAAEVNAAVGLDVSQVITTKGYYLLVQDASAAVRVARGSPPITLYYTDGQSIQQISMPAINIQ